MRALSELSLFLRRLGTRAGEVLRSRRQVAGHSINRGERKAPGDAWSARTQLCHCPLDNRFISSCLPCQQATQVGPPAAELRARAAPRRARARLAAGAADSKQLLRFFPSGLVAFLDRIPKRRFRSVSLSVAPTSVAALALGKTCRHQRREDLLVSRRRRRFASWSSCASSRRSPRLREHPDQPALPPVWRSG